VQATKEKAMIPKSGKNSASDSVRKYTSQPDILNMVGISKPK
jgi:hypothetical protein